MSLLEQRRWWRPDRLVLQRAWRRSLSAGLLIAALTASSSWIAIAHADPKRDLRGFSLGMTKERAARLAGGQCNNFGTVSFQGGTYGELFFDSVREHGKLFSCNFGDGTTISYSVTPRTKKVYKLEGTFISQMNCDELLAFVKETFGVGDAYTNYAPKPTLARSCSGWNWQVSPGYDLKVWIDDTEAARFFITLTDSEIVKENEMTADEVRKRSSVKPRL